jgi:hypothetical protein
MEGQSHAMINGLANLFEHLREGSKDTARPSGAVRRTGVRIPFILSGLGHINVAARRLDPAERHQSVRHFSIARPIFPAIARAITNAFE